MIRTVSGEKDNGSAICTGTAGSANSVDIILRVVGVIIVQHVSDVAHVFKSMVSNRRKMGIATFQQERAVDMDV